MMTRCIQRLSGVIWRLCFVIRDSMSYICIKTIFILQYFLLGMACVAIDCTVMIPLVKKNDFLRAMVDNSGHALIAAISWLIVSGIVRKESIFQAVYCGLMSSFLDIDHFVMAKSLKIKHAISLKTRPPLHTTTIVPLIAPILQVWCGQNIPSLKDLPYIFIIAVLSHHIRDAQRRGLWFWPLGSTPPLPYWVYILCELLLAMVVKDARKGVMKYFKQPNGPEKIIERDFVVDNV